MRQCVSMSQRRKTALYYLIALSHSLVIGTTETSKQTTSFDTLPYMRVASTVKAIVLSDGYKAATCACTHTTAKDLGL